MFLGKKEREKEKSLLEINWQLRQLEERYKFLKEKEKEDIPRGKNTFCLSFEKSNSWNYMYSGLLVGVFLFFTALVLIIL